MFLIAVILGFSLILLWSAFGLPPSYIRDDGGCVQFNTNFQYSSRSKHRHYRFEKCTRYRGLGVNISIYESETNEKLFSKTVISGGFDAVDFMTSSGINCHVRADEDNNKYETCEFYISYYNLFDVYGEFYYKTPRYYLNPPHERKYTEFEWF